MTLISSISNLSGSINNNSISSKMISGQNKSSSSSSSSSISFDSNHSSSLLDTDIMANLLGILGIRIKAKVL